MIEKAGKAQSYGLYRHMRTYKEIIKNLLSYYATHSDSVIESVK